MSEMVEHVSRAICRASGEDPYAWDSIARAAIEAMREPSREMIEASWLSSDSEGYGGVDPAQAKHAWSTMIAAALGEPSELYG